MVTSCSPRVLEGCRLAAAVHALWRLRGRHGRAVGGHAGPEPRLRLLGARRPTTPGSSTQAACRTASAPRAQPLIPVDILPASDSCQRWRDPRHSWPCLGGWLRSAPVRRGPLDELTVRGRVCRAPPLLEGIPGRAAAPRPVAAPAPRRCRVLSV